MRPTKVQEAPWRRMETVPCAILVTLNIGAALTAALALPLSDTLPTAMAVHGALMIVAWGCLLPLGGLVARYFKVTPRQDYPTVVDNPFWWTVHRTAQYSGVGLATCAVVLILRETGGHVATPHGLCGLGLMILAWLQLASPLFRGTKGGPSAAAVLEEDESWRGDHFDMTTRRRLFESWHKPVGWALLLAAQIVIVLGIDLAGSPSWLLALVAAMACSICLAILDSIVRRRWVSTHAALWGPRYEFRAGPQRWWIDRNG